MVSRRPSECIMVRVLVDTEVVIGCFCAAYGIVDLSLWPQDGCDDDDDDEGDLTFC
jgi:hypothetical protein